MRHDLQLAGITLSDWMVQIYVGIASCQNALWAWWEFPLFFRGHWQSPCTALMAGELPAIRAVQVECERVYGVPSVFSSTAGGDSPRESSEVPVTYGGDFPGDSSGPLTLWGLYKVSAISNQNFHLNFVQVTSHYLNQLWLGFMTSYGQRS